MAVNIAAAQEIDHLLKKAMKLLHSTQSSSATELRLMLDDAIKQRYGSEKISLSQRQIDEEANFPGRAATPPPQPQQPLQISSDEIINLTNSPVKTISDSPDTIADSDDGLSGAGISGTMLTTGEADDGNLKEFGDLNCCVCGEMVFTATNRLIECSKCGGLYHQECHKPAITDEEASEDQEHNWQCDICSNKPTSSKVSSSVILIPDEPMPLVSNKPKSSVASSHSSSSSNSSSPYYKQEQSVTVQTSSHKNVHKSSSSSLTKSHKEERSNTKPTASINVISASEKVSSSSSKRSSSHSSKASSTKSSSKHHESSHKRRSHK